MQSVSKTVRTAPPKMDALDLYLLRSVTMIYKNFSDLLAELSVIIGWEDISRRVLHNRMERLKDRKFVRRHEVNPRVVSYTISTVGQNALAKTLEFYASLA